MKEAIIVDNLYPKVKKTFDDKSNVRKLQDMISGFIDRNSDELSAIGPMKMVLFTDQETNKLFNLTGTTPAEVKGYVNKSKDIISKGQIVKYPFRMLMTCVIRYFTLQKDEPMAKLCVTYLALYTYPLVFYNFFKFKPNENVMNYTINNLSNKFKIKQTGTLLGSISETAYGAYELHKKGIEKGLDYDLVQFILAVRTRLNSFMKKIAKEYYDNHKSGRYLNAEIDSNDEDNFKESDSSMYLIKRTVDSVSLKLIVDGPPIKLITLAAKTNSVSVNELRNYITTMVSDERKEDIQEILESILVLYLFDQKNSSKDINTNKFLIYCIDVYKRSNTADKNVIKIKKILDGWLEDLGAYKKTQRLATVNDFRRAIYTFFVMAIMYHNID